MVAYLFIEKALNTIKTFKINSFFAITFIVISTYIIGCLAVNKPMTTLPGLAITLAGLPVYFFWNKAKEKAALERMNNIKPATIETEIEAQPISN